MISYQKDSGWHVVMGEEKDIQGQKSFCAFLAPSKVEAILF